MPANDVHASESAGAESAARRRIPPHLWWEALLVCGLLLVLCFLALNWLHGARLERQRATATATARAQAEVLRLTLHQALSATSALAALVRQGEGQVARFEEVGREIIRLYPGISAVQLAPDGVIRHIHPLASNEKAIGHNLLADPRRTREAFLARDSGRLTLAGPFELLQGGRGAVGRLPVFLPTADGKGRFWGFTTVLVRFPEILDAADLHALARHGYDYMLWRRHPDSGEVQVIAQHGPQPLDRPVAVPLEVPNGEWTISLSPSDGWGESAWMGLGLAGSAFASLLVALIYLQVRWQPILLRHEVARRTRELEEGEQRMRNLGDNLPSGYVYQFTYQQGQPRFLHLSSGVARVHGLAPEAALRDAQILRGMIEPGMLAAMAQAEYASMRSMTDFSFEALSRHVDGSPVWLDLRARPRFGPERQVIWDGVATDITARKHTEESLRQSEQRFRDIAQISADWVWEVDATGRYTYASDSVEHLLGYLPWQVLGKSPFDLMPPDEASRVGTMFAEIAAAKREFHDLENLVLDSQGRPHVTLTSGAPILGAQGELLGYRGIDRDVTVQRQAESRLREAASVFEFAREGIMITDAEGVIIDVNRAFSQLTGYSREEVVGKTPRLLSSGRQSREFYEKLWATLRESGYWSGEIWNRRKSGEVYAEMQTISAVRDAAGHVVRFVALFSDITTLKEHQKELERIAHYDALTGLPNRVLLADRLHQALATADRHPSLLAVVYLDLDGFKAINDQHSHDVGDRLLGYLATRMKHALRESDTLSRLGGDEFVAVLLDLPSHEASAPVLERLLTAAAEPVRLDQLDLRVSASIGVSFFPQVEPVDAEQLLRQADQAMYQAKQSGKNRYHIFDPEQDRAVRGHHETLERIRAALAAGEFEMYYQPKVNMRRGKVVGAEALIRWRHPEHGVLPPGVFLPAVRNNPLSIEIGEWVLETVLEQIETWRTMHLVLSVSVNVDAMQLDATDFVDKLSAALASHPLVNPDNLELEVLETSALEDVGRIAEVIRACREIGIGFALDDFGTGYSTLTYLKRLPAGLLKIDQSFVRDMLDDPEDLAILDGILGLASAFQRRVIAEGVETVAHGAMLLRMGCDYGQGYAIARPMPASALPDWIAQWRAPTEWAASPSVARDDLPLLFAQVEHRAWLDALARAAERGARPPGLASELCQLGKWLAQEGAARHAGRAELDALTAAHRALHQHAVALANGQGGTEAELTALRERFEACLDALAR